MPGFDGTGPTGMGSKTGRGFGRCTTPAQNDLLVRRGPGRGRGQRFRQRWCWDYIPDYPAEGVRTENDMLKQESQLLKDRLKILENSLSEILKKINEGEKPADTGENG